MKLLITSRADDHIKELTDLTFPIIKKFADNWKADFLRLDHVSGCKSGHGKWHYRILKHYELFDKYDRILHIDADILINKTCPNIFNIIDPSKIGTVFEDVGSRASKRQDLIQSVQNKFGDVGWKTGYINTGVFLTSKIHRDIFQKIQNEYWTGFGYDDVHLGYLINKIKHPVQSMPFQFNHMSMFSEGWNNKADRFDSHMLHYAGNGIFQKGKFKNKIEQIKSDKKIIWSF